MPEPFKNLFNEGVIQVLAERFLLVWPEFDHDGFLSAASEKLESLELKQRSDQITRAMASFLPSDFEHAAEILLAALAVDEDPEHARKEESEGLGGFAIMPMTYYVGRHGLDHFEQSMTLFKEMTKRFSSEFGIRYLLLEQPERTLAELMNWTTDADKHVRRLVSEGSRPRLPWGMQLPAFIEDPAPLFGLLEALKDDPEEYVRRSVANNLNDIAKDHPDKVAEIAGQWLKDADKNRKRLVKHACRTLVKQGHKPTLAALGYGAPHIEIKRLDILTPKVEFGTAVEFELSLASTSGKTQPLIIDYAVHHRKANGKTTRKVFKWKTVTLKAGASQTATRQHAIRPITTRKYYPGTHSVEILINGESMGCRDFELVM